MSSLWSGKCDGKGCEEPSRRVWDHELIRTGLGDERLCGTCYWLREISLGMLRDEEMADERVSSAMAWENDYSPGQRVEGIAYRARTALTRAAIRAAEDPTVPFTDVVQAAFMAARVEGGE